MKINTQNVLYILQIIFLFWIAFIVRDTGFFFPFLFLAINYMLFGFKILPINKPAKIALIIVSVLSFIYFLLLIVTIFVALKGGFLFSYSSDTPKMMLLLGLYIFFFPLTIPLILSGLLLAVSDMIAIKEKFSNKFKNNIN